MKGIPKIVTWHNRQLCKRNEHWEGGLITWFQSNREHVLLKVKTKSLMFQTYFQPPYILKYICIYRVQNMNIHTILRDPYLQLDFQNVKFYRKLRIFSILSCAWMLSSSTSPGSIIQTSSSIHLAAAFSPVVAFNPVEAFNPAAAFSPWSISISWAIIIIHIVVLSIACSTNVSWKYAPNSIPITIDCLSVIKVHIYM